MLSLKSLRSGTSLLTAIGVIASTSIPILMTIPAQAQSSFSDVPSNYWAEGMIRELAAKDIIKGFPDGSFHPTDPVTRAQFSAMISKAFNQPTIRGGLNFVDVPSNYWANAVIQKSYTTGFLSGYPGQLFGPNQNIPRVQVLVSLSSGLLYNTNNDPNSFLPQYYSDASSIPSYALNGVAAATQKGIVVNYPNVQFLNPNQNATRADVAAFIYQALAQTGQVAQINSPYVVGQINSNPNPSLSQTVLPLGTTIPVEYKKNRILIAPNETVPLVLIVKQNIMAPAGNLLIPEGTQISGELRPNQNGSRFFAKELVFANGQRIPLNATSEVVTRTEKIRKGIKPVAILRDTAIGAAAATGLAAIFGDRAIATEEVLGGAGIGLLGGLIFDRNQISLISINPNTDLNLKLNNDLALR